MSEEAVKMLLLDKKICECKYREKTGLFSGKCRKTEEDCTEMFRRHECEVVNNFNKEKIREKD